MIDPRSIILGAFVDTWYGAGDQNSEPLADDCDWLPAPLKNWHIMASARHRRLTYSTKMIAPDRMRIGDDGKVVFMIDATGDWRWCFDSQEPNNVFNAERYEPWVPHQEKLPDFLVHNTVREVVYGAQARARALQADDNTLEEILSPTTEIAFPAWAWPAPAYQLFMGNGVLAEIIRSDQGAGWDIDIAATEPRHLSYLHSIPGARWRGGHTWQ